MSDHSQDVADFSERVASHPQVALSSESIIDEILEMWAFLEGSQYQLYELMKHNGIWGNEKAPPIGRGFSGDLEFGLVPRWLAFPPEFIKKFLKNHSLLSRIWSGMSTLIPNYINDKHYTALTAAAKKNGLVADDGTMYGTKKYEQLDEQWAWSLVDYLITRFTKDRATFSSKMVKPIPLKGKSPDQVTIALLGDWGTGDAVARGIMGQITAMKPDYIVHLGDVYYAGTPGADQPFLPSGEEQKNFLDCWPKKVHQKPGTSFTLNSNHEMYSGAKGLFDVALADSRFAAQQGTSYFALQYAGWTILGLDTGFFSQSTLYMVGAIGVDDDPQPRWIKGLGLSPDRTIVLTHYNGLTYDGTAEPASPADSKTTFWDQLNSALGGDPAAWYWGHIHNGIVYDTPTVTGRKTLARCVGHAAIPYGAAWGIKDRKKKKNVKDYVRWYETTPDPKLGKNRVRNGFAMLTIGSEGSVTEELFELADTTPVFSNGYRLPVAAIAAGADQVVASVTSSIFHTSESCWAAKRISDGNRVVGNEARRGRTAHGDCG